MLPRLRKNVHLAQGNTQFKAIIFGYMRPWIKFSKCLVHWVHKGTKLHVS